MPVALRIPAKQKNNRDLLIGYPGLCFHGIMRQALDLFVFGSSGEMAAAILRALKQLLIDEAGFTYES